MPTDGRQMVDANLETSKEARKRGHAIVSEHVCIDVWHLGKGLQLHMRISLHMHLRA